MNGNTNPNRQCVGRFELTVPEDLTVGGRSQSIYRVKVNTFPLPRAGMDAFWKAQLVPLAGIKPPAGVAGAIVRNFELQPGVPAVWYFKDSFNVHLRELKSAKAAGDRAVVAIRGGESGKETTVETLVKNVLNAYSPQNGSGFCVGYGSITSEPGQNEEAVIDFAHVRLSEFEVKFSTHTVREPDTLTHSDLDEEKEVAAGDGGSLTVLRDHTRTVANLPGKEMWIVLTVPDAPPVVRFTWHYPGSGGDSFRPSIDFVGSAHAVDRGELERVWESMLDSLRAVPPAQSYWR